MEVRILRKQEILPALHLVWEVFAEDVAPSYSPEGVAEFQKFIKYDNIISMHSKGELIFFGAFEGEELLGVEALNRAGHICLFFVKKAHQGKGVGRMLYDAGYNHCAREFGVVRMTVNAAPNAVEIYRKLGMRQTASEQSVNGIRFVPMEAYVDAVKGAARPYGASAANTQDADKKRKTLIVGGIIAAVLVLVLMLFFGYFMIKNLYVESKTIIEDRIEDHSGDGAGDDEDPMSPDSPLWDERGKGGDDDSENGEDSTQDGSQSGGSAAIPEDIAANLEYEIGEDSYTFTDEEKKSTLITFDVKYPKLKGLDKKVQDKVNKEIKTCAMQTVDEIYTNPSQEFKEKILGTETPMLVSQVTYKVCYADNRFISIIFEDGGLKGSQNDTYQNLRTLNIALADGKVYEVKDIVELNDEFIEEWLEVMREEAGSDTFLSELSKKEIKETLSGKDIDGNYKVNFFFDEDGIEIGYSFDYADGDENNQGYVWVTAPFTYHEMEEYAKNDDFWAFFD